MAMALPTLYINLPKITKKTDQAIYLLKHLLYNPGWTSSYLDGESLSMRQAHRMVGEDKSKLPHVVEQLLNAALTNCQCGIKAKVTAKEVNYEHNTYRLTISLTASDDETQAEIMQQTCYLRDGQLILQEAHGQEERSYDWEN